MHNSYLKNKDNEKSFYSLLDDINNCKVGFYSVGLYPASLAYNCAMHSERNNILLAPRPERDLLGAFPEEVLSKMKPKIIEKIISMGYYLDKGKRKSYSLNDLLQKCNIVVLSANSNHIQNDINKALDLRKSLGRENVVLACLVGSFCFDDNKKKPYILCEKYPELAFFTGFHRHGALRNPKDSFTANFCHPDSKTSFVGSLILNKLSPNIRVSPGVHNIECQYIKSIKNVSSIFAGFISQYHSDKPGMIPSINTILLSQCLDQAASVSLLVRKKNKFKKKYLSLKELGYGEDKIIAKRNFGGQVFESADYTFFQLNAVKADVLGSMTLPTEGKPTRNFQAGQVLSDLLLTLKRCPKDISEFKKWCNKFDLSQGGLEGLKSLKFWPSIYKEYKIKNNNCSMLNLIYLCFYADSEEKKNIYKVLINPVEITNFCQESVKPFFNSVVFEELNKISNFNNTDNQKVFNHLTSEKNNYYIKAIKIINKYFTNNYLE